MSGLIIIDVDTQKNVQYVIKCIFKSKKNVGSSPWIFYYA